MCDVEKYKKMYKDIEQLTPEDTLNLVLSAEDAEEQEFFEYQQIAPIGKNSATQHISGQRNTR